MTDPFGNLVTDAQAAAARAAQLTQQLADAQAALAAETAKDTADQATIAALQAQVSAMQAQLQPSGPGIVAYQTLTGGSFSQRVNSAPGGNLVSLPPGTVELVDFIDGQNSTAQGASDYGAWLRTSKPPGGLIGSGRDRTVIQLKARSSSKAAAVPPDGPGGAGNPTNNLYVVRIDGPGATVSGLTVHGTDQGHLYNGVRYDSCTDAILADAAFDSIPGDSAANPGETAAVSFNHCDRSKVRNVQIAGGTGSLKSAAGLMANSCGQLDIDGLTVTGLGFSAPVALWQQTGPVTIRNWVSHNNPRHLGAERLAAPVDIYDPVWDAPGIGHDVTLTPWAGHPAPVINFRFTDASKLLGRKIVILTNDASVKPGVHVFVGGVEQPQAQYVTWQGA